jgi:adhesin transport system membrane fusion protein
VATVEVLTGRKSVLDYLLKPARMLRDEALRER